MKQYQNLIGLAMVAVAILIAGNLIANAIESGFSNQSSHLDFVASSVRDGLIHVAELVQDGLIKSVS